MQNSEFRVQYSELFVQFFACEADFDVLHKSSFCISRGALRTRKQVSFNGVIYTYIHNLQGDIVGILDNAGTLVVEYKYDAWGKLISTTGTLADTLGRRNPFRYRGYVYDEETGLYYLRSRYYNPEVGRFINADDTEILFEEQDNILEYNLFAYCLCNPTNHSDDDGDFALTLAASFSATNIWNPLGWAAVAVLAVAIVYSIAKNPDPYGRAGQKNKVERGKTRHAKSPIGSLVLIPSRPKNILPAGIIENTAFLLQAKNSRNTLDKDSR